MITLKKKIQQQNQNAVKSDTEAESRRISIRDKLLIKEVQEMEENMPRTCKVVFDDPSVLHHFILYISPDEGYWQGGRFKFDILVPDDYNIVPPKVTCLTKLWHPNINESGEICLSLLRQNSYDGLGWAPTRRLKDVLWGLNSLFSDLLNFDDPLNVEAAEHYLRDKEGFKVKVREYIHSYAKR